MDDFIEVYEGALDAATCRALIERFERSGEAKRGATGGGVDLALKDSWDIRISGNPAWRDADQALNVAVFAGLTSFPLALVGAVGVGLLESFGSFWASAFKEVIVFSLLIPVLLWRSLMSRHVEEEHDE